MCLNFISFLYGNIKRYNILEQKLFGVLNNSKSTEAGPENQCLRTTAGLSESQEDQ